MEPQESLPPLAIPLSPEFAASVFPRPNLTGHANTIPGADPPPRGRGADPAATDPATPAAPPRGAFKRVLTRDVPKPPFAGKQLDRAAIERLLAVAEDTGRRGKLDLRSADLRGADLSGLDLGGTLLGDDDPLATEEERRGMAAHLEMAQLAGTNLNGIIAPGVSFDGADLRGAHLYSANLTGASFSGARLVKADLREARLTEANLNDCLAQDVGLQRAVLVGAQIQRARLEGAHVEGTDFGLANLTDADLRHAICDEATYFGGAILQGAALDGLRLRDVDLTATDWNLVNVLGEEREAAAAPSNLQVVAFRVAARTYRRFGLALRMQGMSDDGQRFLARARRMEELALQAALRDRWRERAWWQIIRATFRWSGVALQGAITGHGASPGRAIGWAAGVVFGFALLYMVVLPEHPNVGTAIFVSLSDLFGHGYLWLPHAFAQLGLPALLAVLEAIVGTVLLVLFTLALARKTIE